MDGNNKRPKEVKIGILLGKIHNLHTTRANWILDQVGISRAQALLLFILTEKDGLTHTEIAEKLEVTLGALTKVIRRMEALHYIQRQSDPNDERVSRVFLRTEGRAKIRQITPIFEKIDRVLVNELTEDQQNQLIELLENVYTNLFEHLRDE